MAEIFQKARPRERLQTHGVKALSDLELWQLIIGSGVAGAKVEAIAKEVWQLSLRATDLSLSHLLGIPGISVAKASNILAIRELVRRKASPGQTLAKALDVLPLVTELSGLRQEHVLVLSLDGAGCLLDKRLVSIGTMDASLIHPRDVYAHAICLGAAQIIMVHNHPGGDPEPSVSDLRVTDVLNLGGEILGVPLYDHIIVAGHDSFFSFREAGLLQSSKLGINLHGQN